MKDLVAEDTGYVKSYMQQNKIEDGRTISVKFSRLVLKY